ncbi:hypothetical protein ETD86_21760 [Nonomuraea turkmeniaca]|uniref:DUF732 domain-containing protein n=1 Tax=Nonomuraea turkmeniaca TaxID=103838 RepID=A0A5S4FFX8_9ACTN|nr:DUF732 domain-containing protein [Nonomuraea turkmeniaca]TMR18340.1 hypothetical protein ETD86_21760 [Nonomuraea turkmeniaca]
MLLILLVAVGGLAVLAVVGVLLVNVVGPRLLAPPQPPSLALPQKSQGTGTTTPEEQRKKDFLFRLATIAPWLLDEDINWSAATRTCTDIKQGKSEQEVIEAAQERFTDVDAEQAKKIVAEIRTWCGP